MLLVSVQSSHTLSLSLPRMQAGSSELDRQQNGAHYFSCTLSKENISLIFRFVNSTISEVNASAASRSLTLVLTQHDKVVGVLTPAGCQSDFV